VKLIARLGPRINEIAGIMGEHKETVRYHYKKDIIERGMVVQAIPDEEALGLRRIAAKVRVSEVLLPHVKQMFWAMHDLCYATAFEAAIPEEFYVLHAAVPMGLVREYSSFLRALGEMGFFESVEIYEFDWFRRIPMRTEYYDFDVGRWDYNWQDPLAIEKTEMFAMKPRKRARFDRTDLLILKELQIDASRNLLEIKDSLVSKSQSSLTYKTMQWHYRQHIVVGGLIRGFSVRWLGTKYDQDSDRASQRNHKYLVVDMLVKDIGHNEVLDLAGKMHQTPFLWCEMGGDDSYFAQCAFPIESTMEAFDLLRAVMHPFAGKAACYIVDQKNAIQFVLPYKLWNDTESKWDLSIEDILPRFENLILKIKSGAIT
jgi:hypothetical protein